MYILTLISQNTSWQELARLLHKDGNIKNKFYKIKIKISFRLIIHRQRILYTQEREREKELFKIISIEKKWYAHLSSFFNIIL